MSDIQNNPAVADGTDADPGPAPAADQEISPELLHDSYGEEELSVSREDFELMLSDYQSARGPVREGEIVQARVLRVTDSSAILECGFKSEGEVPLSEFKSPEEIVPGQEVEVLLERLEDEEGVVVLSKKKADFLRVWEKIREAYDNEEPVRGLLTRKIKGGVTVDIMGVDAFLPGSQIALRRVPNIEDLIGHRYAFRIIKLNKRRRNIVVSRRVILEGERQRQRTTLVKELINGQVREGVVKNITEFGAFIDLGGLDGLLHITDMSWGRVGHPSEVVAVGQHMDVKVLDIDWSRERISLGLKQLLPYPWTDIEERYPVGARVRGRVVSITNYGAFVELQKGVEGLVHISEMSWTRSVKHPSRLVTIGDEIETVILKVDPRNEKISLGMKQIEEDPWLSLPLKYPADTRVSGTVRNLTTFGAFVEIEPGIDGLVHVSDMSWTKRVEHPSEVVQKGEPIEVKVLHVDGDNKRISLGLKQLYDDPWPVLVVRYSRGHEQEAEVVRVQEKGLVVDLDEGVEGYVPAAHSGVPPTALDEYYLVGMTIPVRVVNADQEDRRIVLEVLEAPERRDDIEAEDDAQAAEVEAAAEEGGEAVGDDEVAEEADEAEAVAEADGGDGDAEDAEDAAGGEEEAEVAEDATAEDSEAEAEEGGEAAGDAAEADDGDGAAEDAAGDDEEAEAAGDNEVDGGEEAAEVMEDAAVEDSEAEAVEDAADDEEEADG